MEFEDYAKDYFVKLKKTIDLLDIEKIKTVVRILLDAYKNNKKIFIMGNGGSAATASHFVLGLAKNTIISNKKWFRVIGLTDNIPLITAWSNDDAYQNVFLEQLSNFVEEGDVVIAISGSGNSENVLRAVKHANDSGAITVGFIGFEGGKLKHIAKESIIAKDNHMGRIEDIHMALTHLIENYIHEYLLCTS